MAKKKKEEVVEKTTNEPKGKEPKGDVTKVKEKMKVKPQVVEETITKINLDKPVEETKEVVEEIKEAVEETPTETPVIEEITDEEIKEQVEDLKFKWYKFSERFIPDKYKSNYVHNNAKRTLIESWYSDCIKIGLLPEEYMIDPVIQETKVITK